MTIKVSEKLLKGNYGEHLVAQILSRSCLVRPVVGNTDIGVDLYCESIIEGKTFLHFWVQVKSSKSIPNNSDNKQIIKFPFKTSSLEYWANQPVPVLGLLVPLEWPPENIRVIHVVDITMGILEKGLKQNQKKQTLETIPYLDLSLTDDNKLLSQLNNLLVHHLPMTVSAIYAEKGFIYPAPKPKEEYTKYFSGHFLHRNINLIGKRLSHAATFGVMQYLAAGHKVEELPNIFIAALEALHDDVHYEVHETLGMVYQNKNDPDKALPCFKKAIFHIEDDPDIDCTVPPWSEKIERLNQRIESLNIKP